MKTILPSLIVLALLSANFAADTFVLHWPWPIGAAEQAILLLSMFAGYRRSTGKWHPRHPDVPVKTITGYTGPFMNKPSLAYLESRTRPFSPRQEISVYIALIVPFLALAWLLLHH